MGDIAIISLHDKGFWQGDLWIDFTLEEIELSGASPDGFFALSKQSTEVDARKKAAELWPTAEILLAADDEDADA